MLVGLRVQGLGLRVWGLGVRVLSSWVQTQYPDSYTFLSNTHTGHQAQVAQQGAGHEQAKYLQHRDGMMYAAFSA